MNIEIPFIQDKELQKRFQDGLTRRGFEFALPKSIYAQTFVVVVKDAQDAFWLGCNYVALANKLFDSGITKTFG